MLKLAQKVKEKLYEKLEFQFKSHGSSYKDILEAVELDGEFKKICERLDLNATVVEDYIKKYVFFIIIEEATSFNQEEIELIRGFSDEPLLDTTIGELFEEIQNEIHYVKGELSQDYLYDDEQSQFSNDNVEEKNTVEDLIYPFSNRSHSFFSIYFNNYVNKKRPIKPRPDKDFNKENFAYDLLFHQDQFTKMLYGYKNGINPTRDILELERETDIYFLLRICSLLPKDRLDMFKYKKEKSNYLKVLASFALIEDVRLKLYFTEQFIKEESSLLFIKGKGYIDLFNLIFVYVPMLKEYLIDKIKVPKGILSIKDNEVDDKREIDQLKAIKKNLFLYEILKDAAGYKLEDLKNELVFILDGDKINNSEYFIDLYKKIQKVKGFRREFCRKVIDDVFERFKEEPNLDNLYLYKITEEFATKGEYLALRLDKDSRLEAKLRAYDDVQFDLNQIKEEFNEMDIDIEMIFKGKK